MDRRDFLRTMGLGAAAWWVGRTASAAERPNVVLCMTDDQGWGDVGYNGHKVLKTPVLDEMAAAGVRFDRFYAAAPVCSPTRGSVMTGRHPNRYGTFLYDFSIRPEEMTLAEVLTGAGYATGHFGKWHLGPVKAGTPVNPGNSGFDEWVSHDNWFDIDPSLTRNGAPPRTYHGESSELVASAALEFIRKAARAARPFLAVVWFGSPHVPHRALAKDRQPYAQLPEDEQHYYGELAAMDRAMGTLRRGLRRLGVAANTLVWFCSDNGSVPPGSTGGLKGQKGMLWEGGIRVPGIIEWPAGIRKPLATDVPCVTSDIYPTILDIVGVRVERQVEPLDGVSLKPLLEGTMRERPKPIAFWTYPAKQESRNGSWLDTAALKGTWQRFQNFKHPRPATEGFRGHAALIEGRYKLHKLSMRRWQLYDVVADPTESRDIAAGQPARVAKMREALEAWQASVERSLSGADYGKKGGP